MSKGIIA